MASIHKDPRGKSPFFYCAFTHADGSRVLKSTKKINRTDANEIARGWQRAVDLARRENLTEAKVHSLKLEIYERANVTLPKHQLLVAQVIGEIYERANGERINFATIEDYLNKWIDSRKLTTAPSTVLRYDHIVKGFLSHLGAKAKRSLGSVTSRDISAFRDLQLKKGKSNKTANLAIVTLSIAFNQARKEGLILANPVEAVERLPENPVVKETFTREQVTDLLRVADAEWKGMILIGACHGLRIGDAASLTWDNVDMVRRSLKFYADKDREGKRRKREVPLHRDVEAFLLSLPLKNNKPDSPLFPTLIGKETSPLCELFADIMKQAGIQREAWADQVKPGGRRVYTLGFHSFRHTSVSEMEECGVSKERRMALVGHTSDVHARYTHFELETLRQEVERVPSFVAPEPAQ